MPNLQSLTPLLKSTNFFEVSKTLSLSRCKHRLHDQMACLHSKIQTLMAWKDRLNSFGTALYISCAGVVTLASNLVLGEEIEISHSPSLHTCLFGNTVCKDVVLLLFGIFLLEDSFVYLLPSLRFSEDVVLTRTPSLHTYRFWNTIYKHRVFCLFLASFR